MSDTIHHVTETLALTTQPSVTLLDMQHKSYILLITGYRVTISWNDAARQCEQIGAHLPFFKRYGPDTLPHKTQMQQYAELQLREWDRSIGLGDITFIGVMRKVIKH